ncbi:hypothetical protein FB451DRAFT_1193603 [Mycena latifolia]|nr:hypothetical protein FB451DRAFT_1193603 [Mycena latifolia]
MTLRLTSPVMSSPRLTSLASIHPMLQFLDGFHGERASIHLHHINAFHGIVDDVEVSTTSASHSDVFSTLIGYTFPAVTCCSSSQAVREEALPDILADPALPIGLLAPFVRGIAGSHRRSVPAIPLLICATRRRTSTIGVQPGAALAPPRVDLCSSIVNIFATSCNWSQALNPSTGIE